jgi:hypothetical protein
MYDLLFYRSHDASWEARLSLTEKGLPVTGMFFALLTIETGVTSTQPVVMCTSDGHLISAGTMQC